jgi:hypothetical protein
MKPLKTTILVFPKAILHYIGGPTEDAVRLIIKGLYPLDINYGPQRNRDLDSIDVLAFVILLPVLLARTDPFVVAL